MLFIKDTGKIKKQEKNEEKYSKKTVTIEWERRAGMKKDVMR